jgi:hypothetical protein
MFGVIPDKRWRISKAREARDRMLVIPGYANPVRGLVPPTIGDVR